GGRASRPCRRLRRARAAAQPRSLRSVHSSYSSFSDSPAERANFPLNFTGPGTDFRKWGSLSGAAAGGPAGGIGGTRMTRTSWRLAAPGLALALGCTGIDARLGPAEAQ